MVQLNLALREINCKIVYFGPGLSGKTTNLEIVHQKAPDSSKGELTSIATESDRTLFFDFMPLNLGKVGGMQTKFQLYTVPGQVYYNSTRKLVLRGADGVVFVADSSPDKMEENIESLDNLEECLREQGRTLAEMPHVLQWNKRDLPDAMAPEDLDQVLNRYGVPTSEAIAYKGDGVIETICYMRRCNYFNNIDNQLNKHHLNNHEHNVIDNDKLQQYYKHFIDYFNAVLAKPLRWTYTGKPLQR